MSETIIRVENLSKQYLLGSNASSEGLRHLIHDVLTAPLRWLKNSASGQAQPVPNGQVFHPNGKSFLALKDVSFEIKQGEVVGIIGRNGAGKSTLLKVLSRITEPTKGRVEITGRVASLLEVGTGFHPELSGRENIFLNGAILGMSRVEIKKKFDEIVAFAEVERFLDTPVKRYSSGMYVRLAFAVAAHLEPEILIVDEVLAVGDLEFQKKCLGKMQSVADKEGRTVLFVSHNMGAIKRLCQNGLLLDHGRIIAQGSAESVVTAYLHSDCGDKSVYTPDPAAAQPGNNIVVLLSACVKDAAGSHGPTFSSSTSLTVEIVYRVLAPARGLRVGFHLHGPDGTIIFNAIDTDTGELAGANRPQHKGVFASSCNIPSGFLNRGQYSVTVGSDTPMMLNFYCENVISFFIEQDGRTGSHRDNRPGLVCPHLPWEIRWAS